MFIVDFFKIMLGIIAVLLMLLGGGCTLTSSLMLFPYSKVHLVQLLTMGILPLFGGFCLFKLRKYLPSKKPINSNHQAPISGYSILADFLGFILMIIGWLGVPVSVLAWVGIFFDSMTRGGNPNPNYFIPLGIFVVSVFTITTGKYLCQFKKRK